MTETFLNLIGVTDEISGQLDDVVLLWARPVFLWIGLIGVLPVAALVWLRQAHSIGHVRALLRGILTGCRAAVFLLLMIVLAGPYVRLEQPTEHKPVLAVLLDVSASMDLPAGPFTTEELRGIVRITQMHREGEAGGEAAEGGDGQRDAAVPPRLRRQVNNWSRLRLMQGVLAAQREGMFKELSERFDVRFYRVGRGVERVDIGRISLDALARFDDDGDAPRDDTALGDAIARVRQDAVGRGIAGVVMLTDGRWTIGPEPLRAAGAGTSTVTPIWPVPMGSDTPPPDVALVDLLMPTRVPRGEVVSVIASVVSYGLDGQRATVKLEAGEETDEAEVVLQEGRRQEVSLSFTAGEPGIELVRIEVEELTGEDPRLRANNRKTRTLHVETDRLEVLLIEGYPRWDYRFLDYTLRRDRGIEQPVKVIMQSELMGRGVKAEDLADAAVEAGMPGDVEAFAEYDVVILGDVSPLLLAPNVQSAILEAVEEKGVGLIIQGGFKSMPHLYRPDADADLLRLLPVEPGEAGQRRPDAYVRTGIEPQDHAPFEMRLTADGAIHPAFQAYTDPMHNRRVWDRMPPFYWAVAAERTKPGATLLAELRGSEGDLPLIAEQFVGRGRVLMVGFDSTFTWRRNIGNVLFDRFWQQAIRHVARDPQRSGERSWIAVYPPEVEPGRPAAIELFAVDDEGRPLRDDRLEVSVRGPGSPSPITMTATGEPGHFRALWQPPRQGVYRLRYRDAAGRDLATDLRASDADREMRNPTVDRTGMALLADRTGGRLLEPGRLHRLGDLLEGDAVRVDRSMEDEIWDNWLTLLLLVGLYCLDVGVRRAMGLT